MGQAGISHDGTPTAHQKEMVANLIVTYVLQGKDEPNAMAHSHYMGPGPGQGQGPGCTQ